MNLNFQFNSKNYMLYRYGQLASGPHEINQVIKVEPNSDRYTFTLTIHNLDLDHRISNKNVQMAASKMLVVEEITDKIVLRGTGHDLFGCRCDDYKLTIILKDGFPEKLILHMENRDIEYLKAEKRS
jgi:hypothetical protein